MNCRVLPCLLIALVASTPPAAGQTVVAKVKVHNRADEAMKGVVVRGALPLPRDYDKPIHRLALRDGTKLLPTQVSVFSTYPGSDEKHPVGRPEIVHLAAKVDLPAKAFKQFDVAELPAAPEAAPAAPGKVLSAWLAGKAPVVVEATDCFGNRYRCRPLEREALIETRQAGRVLVERVFQSALTPVGEVSKDKPALKRFLRVRAYLTTYAGEEFASLALVIHNGSIDHPNGQVTYRDIRVGVARPVAMDVWHKRLSPAVGAAQTKADGYVWQPCPPPHKAGKVYVMRPRAAAVLRTFVYAPAAKARATLHETYYPRFVPVASGELFSWSNAATARYGANNYPVPMALDKETRDRFVRRALGRLDRDDFGLSFLRKPPKGAPRRLGHAIPAGVRYGGMTGGAGVQYTFGLPTIITGLNAGFHLHVLLADRHWDRHRAYRFYDDGRPYTHSRHLIDQDGRELLDIPLDKRSWPTERVTDPACKAQADYVKAEDLLAGEAKELLRYMNHDDQHLSRVFDAVPAAYLACDPVSRDRLVTLGAQVCAKLNIYGHKSKPNWGGYGSLLTARQNVTARPHKGIHMGRANGWLNQALAHGFYLSRDKRIRADCIDVATADTEIRAAAQMPAGNVTVHRPYSKAFNGEYWYVNAWQTVGIMGDGARCLAGILDAPETKATAGKLKAVYARVGRWSATIGWNETNNAPAGNVALRRKGQAQPLAKPYIQATKGRGTDHYFGSPYLWYYEITGDTIFLDRLGKTARGKVEAAGQRHLPNWSYVLWLAQGGKLPGRKGFAEK